MDEANDTAARGPLAPRACVLLASAPDEATAARIARTLVDEQLVACVSRVPGAVSIYRWQGVTEETREVILFAKTTEEASVRATERLRELHPYECPEVLVLDVTGGFPPYLLWLQDSVHSSSGSPRRRPT